MSIIKDNLWIFRSIFKSIWFNLHYLPFKQAIRLPILLYKPQFMNLGRGKVLIDSQQIKFGMIKLGNQQVSIYPNNGIMFQNNGTITFKGKCSIGGNSAISISQNGNVIFGDKFGATTTFKLVSYNNVIFGDNVLFGWDCLVMDTDFHKLTKIKGGFSKGYGEVYIGNNNWFGCKCSILKNTMTPNYCTISSGSILNKKYDLSRILINRIV